MGQRPTSVRVKVSSKSGPVEQYALLTIREVAQLLGVSERTVFRRIRAGELERVDGVVDVANRNAEAQAYVGHDSDKLGHSTQQMANPVSLLSQSVMSHDALQHEIYAQALRDQVGQLEDQLREKDIQIAQLMRANRDASETIERLQQQLYEFSKLIIDHHIDVEQIRMRMELERMKREGEREKSESQVSNSSSFWRWRTSKGTEKR